MSIEIKTLHSANINTWDTYVSSHPDSTLYHLSGWKNVIEKTYGHKSYYLIAQRPTPCAVSPSSEVQQTAHNPQHTPAKLAGILPLVHIKHFLFNNSLISVPFFDYGGILADDPETEKAFIYEAIKIGRRIGAEIIELRQIKPLSWMNDDFRTNTTSSSNHSINTTNPINWMTKSSKVRMILRLPESSDKLMKSFKSKLRSQIKKPLKEGLKTKIGGLELINDFYKVFTINMRDLGSPVHSKTLIWNVLEEFKEKAKIIIVYRGNEPAACSLVVGFKGTLENPWASALRQYRRLSPNMLLYWTMLEYACDNGFKHLDFGRSTQSEGTYKFKEQWGTKPEPLHWHYISLDGKPIDNADSEKTKFDKAIRYWQKLPVPVTRAIGPRVRKYIGL